tara:strand:+ start:2615 stop:2890 length:276 start_codon:yes stop_codon:yes gene_type:complete
LSRLKRVTKNNSKSFLIPSDQRKEKMEKIEVPNYVFNDLNSVRDSGIVNMFLYTDVCQLVGSKTEKWIRDDLDRYGRCIMFGIVPESSVNV